jgi:hypothetical protein
MYTNSGEGDEYFHDIVHRTVDVQATSAHNYVGTHGASSTTHDDDSGVLVSDESYEKHYGVRDPMLDVLRQSYLHVWTLKGTHVCFVTYTEHAGKCKNAWDQLYTDRIREECCHGVSWHIATVSGKIPVLRYRGVYGVAEVKGTQSREQCRAGSFTRDEGTWAITRTRE